MPHQNRSKKQNRCSNPTPAKVKALRESMGMSMSEFAKITCSTQAAVSRWESGDRKMQPILWAEYLRHEKLI